jgi:hypothetical protein
MPCVNHPEAAVQSYCQNCGKALCTACIRTTPGGQILCEPCFVTAGNDPSAAYWQAASQGFPVPPIGAPNPGVAAVLGLIPGVGAMYNGQLFKGLIHVVIFAVLVSLSENYGVFGLFIAAWVLYQSFEAFHTAKARRDGQPLPDPFGLNELGSWLNLSGSGRSKGQPPAGYAGPAGYTAPGAPGAPGQSPYPPAGEPPFQAGSAPGYQAGYPPTGYSQPGYPPAQPFTEPFAAGNPADYPPGYIPPVQPYGWRRREPVWAIVLILLGVLFLLNSLHIFSHLFHFAWPVILIGLGVFLIVRRVGDTRGGPK